MKRTQKNSFAVAAIALAAAGSAHTAQAQTMVQLNGQPLATSVAPIRVNGTTLVPMRDIFQALGANVNYNSLTRGIAATRGSTHVNLQIGNSRAQVNGHTVYLARSPMVIAGSTLVPLRFVSEALGAQVAWNGARELVSIEAPGRVAAVATGSYPGHNTAVAGSRTISIPSGAVVPVTLDQPLSSSTAQNGDVFQASVQSQRTGDSEFPPGTKIEGVISQVVQKDGSNPGGMDLNFRTAILPDGTRVPLQGTVVSLDGNSVTRTQGRIMAKAGKNQTGRDVLIGAGAGFVVGKLVKGQTLLTGLLGAAAGYLFSQKDAKAADVNLAAGSKLGVRLDNTVSYADTSGYYQERSSYLRM